MSSQSLPGARTTRVGTRRQALAYTAWKRCTDLVLGGALLLLLLPVMLVAGAAVKLSSPGPVLFRQVRVGRHGAPFRMLKFRSMTTGCDDALHRTYVTRMLTDSAPPDGGQSGVYKIADDPRVTRVGRLLRRSSVDELPQLLNVLKGEMSLVGPRPALQWEVELYEPRYHRRLVVKPGLTGLWQVNGRSALSMRDALEIDLQYVDHASLRLDAWILMQTPRAVLRSVAR